MGRTRAAAAVGFAAVGVCACAAVLNLDDARYADGSDAGSNDASLGDGALDASADGGAVDVVQCDVDVASDPLNCGACGHRCLGGGCEAGACQPFLIASGMDMAGLAVVGQQVYWSETNGSSQSLRTCVLGTTCDGGAGEALLNGNSGTLAADDTTIYWCNGGGVLWSCPRASCSSNPSQLQCGSVPAGIASRMQVHDKAPFWISGGTELWTCPAGGTARRLAQAAELHDYRVVASDGGAHVYFTTSTSVRRCTLATCSGGAEPSFYDSPQVPRGITLTPEHVFWLEADTSNLDPRVRQASLDGGGLVMLARAGDTQKVLPLDLVEHDGVLYWATFFPSGGDGIIERCAPEGDAGPPCPGATFKAPTFVDNTPTGAHGYQDGNLLSVDAGLFWYAQGPGQGSRNQLRGVAW